MRKLTLFNLSVVFLFALAAATEGSVQIEPVQPRSVCTLPNASPDSQSARTDSADFRTCAGLFSLTMPRLVIDACAECVGLAPRAPITLRDLAQTAGWQRQIMPEPCTIAIWSLIGLCWGGVSCWRRRQGLIRSSIGRDSLCTRRHSARPPWPDDARAKIFEIIEKGVPR
jgi:hypothetical protein